VVYKTEDATLRRFVALMFLPDDAALAERLAQVPIAVRTQCFELHTFSRRNTTYT
jgi:hypothetical protein